MSRKQRRLGHKGQGDFASPKLAAPVAVQNLFAEACRHHQAGRLPEAERTYRQFLAVNPRQPDALHLLGVVAYQSGRQEAAVDLIGQAIGLRDDVPVYHNNLGIALGELGRFGEAVTHYKRALTLKPDFVDARFNLGNALQEQGRLDEAIAHYQRAIAFKPGYAEAHNNLGNGLKQQGKLDEGMVHYQRAIALKPDYAEAHNNLGIVLKEQGKLDEAMVHFQRAVALKPGSVDAHTNLGNGFKQQGKYGEAMAHYQHAIALKPDYAGAHNNLGIALKELGQFDEAQRASERALELAPRNGRYYRQLFDGRRVVAGDRGLAAAEKLAEDMASLPVEDQRELYFALGKAYADLEQRERSFRHFLEGNALKRRVSVYDEPEMLGLLGRIRTVFTAELMHDKRGLGDPSMVPIFIVGMPRSGTTLVEQILASHPKVFGAGELQEFSKAVTGLGMPNGALSFPEAVPALSEQQLRQLGTSYLDVVGAVAPEAERITDKMPANFSFVGLIHLALPNARIIHMRRDPVDTCLSCFSLLFAGDLPYCYDLGELGRYYRAYQTLMEHWRQVLPAGVMLKIRYEEVVADVERQARQIVAHCGLEWDDACLAFYKTQRPIRTASATQVRQPIYSTSVGRWKSYQHLLQPLIKELSGETEEVQEVSAAVSRIPQTPRPRTGSPISAPPSRHMNRKQRRAETKTGRPVMQAASSAVQQAWVAALHHYQRGRLDEAERFFRQVLAVNPRHADSLHLLGVIAYQTRRHDLAVELIRKAIAINPREASLHSNLGNLLLEQGRLDEAVVCYRTALNLKPDFSEARNNLGNALGALKRPDEAVASYRRALALSPDDPDVHYNLGTALLARGDMPAGWEEYEWRWKTPQMIAAHRPFAQPQWRGEAAEGRTLLIHAEQGLGDTLHFCRYAPLAAARGLRIILEAPKPLTRLLRSLPGVDRIVAQGQPLPPFDLHCPMLSMPLALGTTITTIPGDVPYLHGDAAQVAAWRTRLAVPENRGPRIGVVWAGNPRKHLLAAAALGRRRSIAADRLAPLFELPGLHFFSLQKDGPAAPEHFPLTDFMAEMEDFADTAALIANLDLIISVDTSVVHLAAALGKPVWLLNCFDCCWRWLVGRRDSPWYPGMRL